MTPERKASMLLQRTSILLLVLVHCACFASPTVARMQRGGRGRTCFTVLTPVGEDTLPSARVDVVFPLTLRIGVMDGQETVKVSGGAAAFVTGEGKVFKQPRSKAWSFRRIGSRPARLRHHVAVKTFRASEVAAARELVEQWKRRGRDAGLWMTGQQLAFQGQVFHDNRSIHVVVDHADDAVQGETLLKALAAEGHRPWLIEETLEPACGSFALCDETGRALHSFVDRATILSSADVKVLQVEHGRGYSWHAFQDRVFRGKIEVCFDKAGMLSVVNRVLLEDYLLGVVPSEISATAPLAAIRAQAVAARGETLAKLGLRHEADPFDLCATQHCQVYGGKTKEHGVTSAAVRFTSGAVLVQDGRIQDAVYSACCGGHTENNENVWSSPPASSLRGVPCFDTAALSFPSPIPEDRLEAWIDASPAAWCKTERTVSRGHFRWQKRFTAAELDAVVAKTLPEVGAVQRLEVMGRGVSGRLLALRVVGERATVVVPKELAIRRLFGGLRSGCFVVHSLPAKGRERGDWEFRGAGWGHGVGLCQVGAQGMAHGGATYEKILCHYYRGTTIRRLRPSRGKTRPVR